MKKVVSFSLWLVLLSEIVFCQTGLQKHNPLFDFNLSPTHNERINPISNRGINPKYNWNVNPMHNDVLNPLKNLAINPQSNLSLNPNTCQGLNPMFTISLQPKNPAWAGTFLFDKEDKLIGFISLACQQVLLSFNANGDWAGYFARSSYGMFNEFGIDGKWTGRFLCPDSSEGYNLFSNDGEWTGEHIK